MQTEAAISGIAHSKPEEGFCYPGKKVEILDERSYRVTLFADKGNSIMNSSQIAPSTLNNKPTNQFSYAIIPEKKTAFQQAQAYQSLGKQLFSFEQESMKIEKEPQISQKWLKGVILSSERVDKAGHKQKKLEEKKEQKQKKQREKRLQEATCKPKQHGEQESEGTVCVQLRILMDKLGRHIVKSWNSKAQSEQIEFQQVEKLQKLLSLENMLPVQDILGEWLVERFIGLIKQAKIFRLPRYRHLEKLLQQKYKQVVAQVSSEGFHQVEIRDERKIYISDKIKKVSLDIYASKI